MSAALNVSPVMINMTGLIFILMFAPMAMISVKFNRMVYPATILRVCSVALILMVNLRLIFHTYEKVWCLLVPAFGAALFQAPINSCIGQITALWFPQKQQGISTGICGLAISIGSVIAYLLPLLCIDQDKNEEDFMDGLNRLINVQAIITTCLMMFCILFMRSKPNVFPT